ncbi:MAG: tRNA 4-thiouridine(8) synthase ThiI, partial [Clostridia bacterium]
IREQCDEEYFTLIMRRFMMKISQIIAQNNNCDALITGESLGQVASQTIMALACTDNVCTMPVFRPVIGMDKEEIIQISRKIDTFETSIEPFEDCCTVFTPKHPRTKPKLENVINQEKNLDIENLINRSIEQIETIIIG